MSRYRVTLGFLKHTMGPTETYITPDVQVGNATALIQRMIDLRSEILFDTVSYTGVRISTEGVKARSVMYPPGGFYPFVKGQVLTVPERGKKSSSAVTARPDHTRTCLQVRLTYDTDRRCVRYFNFPPDAITLDEPGTIFMSGDLPYALGFDKFWNELIEKGWAINARNRGEGYASFAIKDWVQASSSPANLGVSVPLLPAPGIQLGDKVKISGVRRRGRDQTSYNGEYLVHSVNPTLVPDMVVYYLRGTESGDPETVRIPGTITKLGKAYFPIQSAEALRTGSHKRGKPLGSPSGRAVRRYTLGQ